MWLSLRISWTQFLNLFQLSRTIQWNLLRLRSLHAELPDKSMKILMMSAKFCSFSYQSKKPFTLSSFSSLSSITIEILDFWKWLILSFTLMTLKQRKNMTSELDIKSFSPVFFTTTLFTILWTLFWQKSALLWKKLCLKKQLAQSSWWKKQKKFCNKTHFTAT